MRYLKLEFLQRLACLSLSLFNVTSEVFAEKSEPVTIEVGSTNIFPPALEWFQDQIRSFENAHPNIRVKTTMLGAPYRPVGAKLQDIPRIAANVVGIEGAFGNETEYLASRGMIVPIEDFQPDAEFSFDQYYDNMWEPVRYDGKTWGVPWSMDAEWLFCNWPIFEKEGISEPPRTWEELVEVARRLTKDTDGDGTNDYVGLRLDPSIGIQNELWLTLSLQDRVTMQSNGVPSFDDPVLRENLDFIRNIIQADFTDTNTELSLKNENGGEIGMLMVGNFALYSPRLLTALGDLFRDPTVRVATMPTRGEKATVNLLRLYLAVRKSTPEKEAASWEFVKWINRPYAPLPDFWIGFPCRKDTIDRPDFEEWASTKCMGMKEAFEALSWSRAMDVGYSMEAFAEFTQVLRKFYAGEIESDRAIQLFNEQTAPNIFVRNSGPKRSEVYRP